jgi:uncharacterized protein with NRDE domain
VCLVLFAYGPDERGGSRLVVAANRDEFYARPALGAHHWEDAPEVFAGRDLQAGGTWLGVTASGRFAAVTNFSENPDGPDPPLSRGDLTSHFLINNAAAMDYARGIDGDLYRGFSLLLFDGEGLVHASNRNDGPRFLEPGVHGLANTHLDTDDHWPKVIHGRRALGNTIADAFTPADLITLLADAWIPPDDELPARGNTIEFERQVAPCFIRGEQYGTRASTAVIINSTRVEVLEQSYGPDGEVLDSAAANLSRVGHTAAGWST